LTLKKFVSTNEIWFPHWVQDWSCVNKKKVLKSSLQIILYYNPESVSIIKSFKVDIGTGTWHKWSISTVIAYNNNVVS
jgi:hypothetical protein